MMSFRPAATAAALVLLVAAPAGAATADPALPRPKPSVLVVAAAETADPVLPRPKPPVRVMAQAEAGPSVGSSGSVEVAPLRPECAPGAAAPPADCDNLSDHLGETGGVIRPPATGDDMHVPAPDPMPGRMPIIPPGAVPDDPATPDVDESTAVPK